MGGIVQVCCGGKHPCRCVGPASVLRGFNGVLHSVFNFHDTKTPTGSIDDRPVPQLVVPIASLLRSQDGPRFARGPSSRRLLISRSESYNVIYYRSLGVLVLVAFMVACGGHLLASVGMALTPNLYDPGVAYMAACGGIW